jgi:hypothetical protein
MRSPGLPGLSTGSTPNTLVYKRRDEYHWFGDLQTMRKSLVYAIAVASLLTGCGKAEFYRDADRTATSPLLQAARSPDQITIANDPGGRIAEYRAALMQLRESGKPLRLAGRCASACTLYLSLPPEQLCISPNTTFLFHAPTTSSKNLTVLVQSRMLNTYPSWVRAWISDRGGLTKRLLVMDYQFARKYLPTCKAIARLHG